MNNSQQNIFIPNMLTFFDLQLRGSLQVFRLTDGGYKMSGVRTGSKPEGLHGISGISYVLENIYLGPFVEKKKFGEGIITKLNGPSGQRSVNSLFLIRGETFMLYHLNNLEYCFRSEGTNKLIFKLNGKLAADLPEKVSGFKMYGFDSIELEPVFVYMRKSRSHYKTVFKNSFNKLIQSTVWENIN
ncbi:hypothetical protein [Pedobacter sp. JCM 36344]|uniref:hypothetical protein n=1 Tax=Pedobacter sp. JCM 36344 TaxID=3374280 RepID=UPI00397BDCF9